MRRATRPGRPSRGVIAVAAGLALLAVSVAALPAAAQGPPPLRMTLAFQSPPAGLAFGPTDPIALVVVVENVSAGPVFTTEGFSAQEFWRRLYFTDPLGRTVINAAEATIHGDTRVYQCLSRGQTLLATALPVVPVEVLAGPPAPGGEDAHFYREFTMAEARDFFDLGQAGRYQVTARVPLQVFAASDQITDCDQFPGQSVLDVGSGTPAQSFVVESNTLEFVVVNTGTGSNVTVQPIDSTTGTTPVEVTFGSVTQAGATSLTTSGTGTPPPSGFSVGNPPVYYDLATTAGFTPPVTVCITYSQPAFGDESAIRLFHFEGGSWQDVTLAGYPDVTANRVCGEVTSLSAFAAFEGAVGNQGPVANAGPNQTVVVGGLVTLDGSASSDPDQGPGPLTFAWTHTGGPVPVVLAGADTAMPTFSPPVVGAYAFGLIVGDGATTSAPASVTVTVQYRFDGFLSPLDGKSFRVGSTVPVKFRLLDAGGGRIGTATASIRVVQVDPPGPQTVTGQFRYDPRMQQYVFNLKTKGLSAGLWRIDAILDDGTIHSVQIRLR